MKNIIKEILISQLSFPLKYKNEKEIWWEDKWEPFTIEITDAENEQYVIRKYYKNGRLWIKENYYQGQQHDEWLRWYANGQLYCKINYHQGQRHGECVWWYDDGQLRCKENYHQGQQHGEYLRWYMDGKLSCKKEYNHGKLINEEHY